MSNRCHASSDSRSCTSRRSTGSMGWIPRIPSGAEPLRLGHGDGSKLRSGGLAHQDKSSFPKPLHLRAIRLGGCVGNAERPVTGRPALNVVEVLDRNWHTNKRRQILCLCAGHKICCCLGFVECTFIITQSKRVQSRIKGVCLR